MSRQKAKPQTTPALAIAGDLRVLIGQFKRRLREQGGFGDLTWSQLSVLGHLEREGPATVTTLAKIEGVRPQSMGAIVAALEAAGHITGTPDPKDGRQTILSLTDACRAWIKAARATREDWLCQAIETHLNAEEQGEVARAVELLRRLVEP